MGHMIRAEYWTHISHAVAVRIQSQSFLKMDNNWNIMSQHINKIRNTLDHDHFANVSKFPQIAEEENYTTEVNGTTLNEAIANFEHITEFLDTAIEKDIIQVFGNSQLNNIRKKLVNVRKEASNIENRNGGRNNPGRDFINQVDNLRAYVIGLGLDLRVGEHLDFSQQLNNLKETREEHQKAHEILESADQTHKEIDAIHEDIVRQKDRIAEIVTSANESQEKIETIENNVSSTSQNVKNNADTINQHYEEVLKKTEQINNYEDRLEDNLSEIEERSEQLNKQQEDINEIEGRIDTLLNGAVAASLDRNFSERKDKLERAENIWAGFTFTAIIGLIVGAFLIFENITQAGGFGAGTISRVTLLIPLLVGVWFTSKNHSRKRRLKEEYAFKSTMAQTLEPSRKVLESQESLDETDAQLAEFMLVSMGQMFTNPSDIVENGSTTTEDDATNIETVMDLAKRIAKGE